MRFMFLEQPWDRGNPRSNRPAWSVTGVGRALLGVSSESETRWEKSQHNGMSYQYQDIRFGCGCEVKGDRGWIACNHPLHALLALEPEKSFFARRYFTLLENFRGVLRAAWEKHKNFRSDTGLREAGQSPVLFRETHDLSDREIWTDTGLHADLTIVPGLAIIELFNAGNASRPMLALHLTIERPEPEPDYGAREMATPLDVSEYGVAEIIEFIPAP